MSPRTPRRSPIPGPLCFWRYLLLWCLLAPVFVVAVAARAAVTHESPRVGAAVLKFGLGFACLAWILETAYVRWKEYQSLDDDGDYCGAPKKALALGAVAFGGLCPLFIVTWVAVTLSGGLATKPADPPAAPAPPAAEPAPAAVTFDPTTVAAAGSRPVSSATRVPGLLAYWPFDDWADDLGPAKQTARVVGGKRAPGARGGALWITGPKSHADLGAHPTLNFAAGAPFTVGVWVRTATDGVVLSFRNAAEPGAVVMLSVEDGKPVWSVRADRGTGPPAVLTGPPVADGRWHHAAGVRNADGTIELAVDGKVVGPATVTAGGPITTDLRFLGREEYRSRANEPGLTGWAGVADELAVFGRRLSADEIAALAGRR